MKQRFEPVLHPSFGRRIEALRGVEQSRVDSVVRRLRRAAREYGKEVDSYIPRCLSLKDLPATLFAGQTRTARQKHPPTAIQDFRSEAEIIIR